MYTKFERLLWKSLTTLEVMAYNLVVHAGPGQGQHVVQPQHQMYGLFMSACPGTVTPLSFTEEIRTLEGVSAAQNENAERLSHRNEIQCL